MKKLKRYRFLYYLTLITLFLSGTLLGGYIGNLLMPNPLDSEKWDKIGVIIGLTIILFALGLLIRQAAISLFLLFDDWLGNDNTEKDEQP